MDDEEPTSESGRCAIHPDASAARICERCGNFMCAECDEGETQRACPPCRARVDLSDFPIDRESFSVGGVIGHAWDVMKQHGLILSGGAFVYLLAGMGFGIVQQVVAAQAGQGERPSIAIPAFLLTYLLQLVVTGWLVLGLVRMAQDALEGRTPQITTIFGQGRKLWKYLAAGLAMLIPIVLLMGLILGFAGGVGAALGPRSIVPLFLLFVVLGGIPMIYVSLGVAFTICEITYDDEVGPLEAIGRSWKMVSGHRWPILGLGIIVWLGLVAGMMLCCVGMIPAYGFAFLTLAVIHRALRNGMELPDPLRPTQF